MVEKTKTEENEAQETQQSGVGTTGHSWDGIEELNNPLPRWWLWVFYLTIFWGIAFTILYPAWPLIKGATPGLLGYSSRETVEAKTAAHEAQNADLIAELSTIDLASIETGSPIANFAAQSGEVVFATSCATCHGIGANGSKGYPNLIDDDWLWGGDLENIHFTITHGINSELDDDTRISDMTAHKDILSREEIDAVAEYVLSLTGPSEDAEAVAEGKLVFAENCVSCHMEDATGDREQGAPNLTDEIWLLKRDKAQIVEIVSNGRSGVMPAWRTILTPSEINAVSYYVHQLGGGE